jgi:hypothetical protein
MAVTLVSWGFAALVGRGGAWVFEAGTGGFPWHGKAPRARREGPFVVFVSPS